MQEIGELLNDLIVLGIFIYVSLLVSGKIKLKPEKQSKLDGFLTEKGKWFKPMIYCGTILFIVSFTMHLFRSSFIMENLSLVHETTDKWTEHHKEKMTQTCIDNAKNSYANDPRGTAALCECVTEKLVSKYTHREAMIIDKMSEKEMIPIMMPIIKACMNETKSK